MHRVIWYSGGKRRPASAIIFPLHTDQLQAIWLSHVQPLQQPDQTFIDLRGDGCRKRRIEMTGVKLAERNWELVPETRWSISKETISVRERSRNKTMCIMNPHHLVCGLSGPEWVCSSSKQHLDRSSHFCRAHRCAHQTDHGTYVAEEH